ncbi:MAG: hypothetical protein WBG71_04680 [Leeuwenhoekiella sp.]
MKTTSQLLLLIAILISSSTLQAKIWRVNNQSNFDNTNNFGENYGGTPAYPVFKQINQAVANANVKDGDTLHVESSIQPYIGTVITKRLVIIGGGYFVTDNSKTSNNVYDTRLGQATFSSGSEGSELIGFNMVSVNSTSDRNIYIRTNNIAIKRCRIEGGIGFNSSLVNIEILQNIFVGTGQVLFNACCTSFVAPQDLVFNNNIVQKKLIWTNNIIESCKNNVFDGPPNELNLDFNTNAFHNNILRAAGITANINEGTNANVEYNTVSNSGVFQDTPENVLEPAMNNLFVDSESPDGRYQLKSDATNNVPGKDGAERGAFGGATVANRYNLSGLAAIPVIYSVSTTGVSEAGDELPVNVKARTNY